MNDFEKEMKLGVLEEMDTYLSEINQILTDSSWDNISDEQINKMFRHVHSIKGNCKVANYEDLAEISHFFEDLLIKLRDKTLFFTADILDVCLDFHDRVSESVEILKHNLEARIDFSSLKEAIESVMNNVKIEKTVTNKFIPKELFTPVSNIETPPKKEINLELLKILKMKILVVDDDPDFTNYVTKTISSNLKINCDVAVNGEVGLEYSKSKEYSIIICDYNMPELNGADFIKVLRNQKGVNQYSFIIFTSAYEVADLDEIDWENVVYLQKPLTSKRLIHFVRFGVHSLLKKK